MAFLGWVVSEIGAIPPLGYDALMTKRFVVLSVERDGWGRIDPVKCRAPGRAYAEKPALRALSFW